MGRLRDAYRNMDLRQSFIVTVFVTFGIAALVSVLIVGGCASFRAWLLPDSDTVFLTVCATTTDGEVKRYSARLRLGEDETTDLNSFIAMDGDRPVPVVLDPTTVAATVAKAENSYTMLTPKRKLAYRCSGAAMVVLPVALSVGGVLFCGFFFYRRKLYLPLKALSEATARIAEKDLDFRVDYGSEDELGTLCRSFEEMRAALRENHRELWKMLEERRLIQASVAHDLRNPIAIIEGYAEYLQLHLQAGDLPPKRLGEIAGSIGKAAGRLERYTESVRAIDQLDEIEIRPRQVSGDELMAGLTSDLTLMAADAGKTLRVTGGAPLGTISVDAAILYRILENILSNALRYAGERIEITAALEDRDLVIAVADDGAGFPEKVLKDRDPALLPAADADGHRGMGLTISRLLCRKHGGRLELANRTPHGAVVKIRLKV